MTSRDGGNTTGLPGAIQAPATAVKLSHELPLLLMQSTYIHVGNAGAIFSHKKAPASFNAEATLTLISQVYPQTSSKRSLLFAHL